MLFKKIQWNIKMHNSSSISRRKYHKYNEAVQLSNKFWHNPLYIFAKTNQKGKPPLAIHCTQILSIPIWWAFVKLQRGRAPQPFQNQRQQKQSVWLLTFCIAMWSSLSNFCEIKFENALTIFNFKIIKIALPTTNISQPNLDLLTRMASWCIKN